MTIEIKPETLKDIADYLDMGMLCFYHKTTRELVYYPEDLEFSDFEDEWAEETGKIEAARGDYFEFEKMNSHEAFRVMESFVDGINHIPTHHKFIDALSRKNPFANFNHLISYYPDLRQEWFAYKNQSHIAFVKDQVEAHNNTLEFGEDI
ncbi:UPF0158 family protein [Mucilaginibacter sp.]|uniref:UPF0158 family protein n=1 Tax=Mucilaginibacter sp. TaxID=1882438 RepID=UPI00284B4F6A|nr:UPF0158 family protein [Mucilaginibacter sp.]MDR3695302.1 UPF0158 family protein [Mucilaginibacter sp.]